MGHGGATKASFPKDHDSPAWPGCLAAAACWGSIVHDAGKMEDGTVWGKPWHLQLISRASALSPACVQPCSSVSPYACGAATCVLQPASKPVVASLASINNSEGKKHRNNHGCATLTSKLAEFILFSPRKVCAVFVFCSWLLMAY